MVNSKYRDCKVVFLCLLADSSSLSSTEATPVGWSSVDWTNEGKGKTGLNKAS